MSEQKNSNWFVRHKILAGIITVIVLIGIGGALGGGDKTSTTQDSASTPSAEPKKAESAGSQVEETEEVVEKPSVPAEYQSALVKADSYANSMDMSKEAVYDQLVSQYGEKFSKKAAQYAIEHVEADWNANALAKAKDYQDQMSMSPAAIHDQLTSQYGEKFTAKQADYALKHLND